MVVIIYCSGSISQSSFITRLIVIWNVFTTALIWIHLVVTTATSDEIGTIQILAHFALNCWCIDFIYLGYITIIVSRTINTIDQGRQLPTMWLVWCKAGLPRCYLQSLRIVGTLHRMMRGVRWVWIGWVGFARWLRLCGGGKILLNFYRNHDS